MIQLTYHEYASLVNERDGLLLRCAELTQALQKLVNAALALQPEQTSYIATCALEARVVLLTLRK